MDIKKQLLNILLLLLTFHSSQVLANTDFDLNNDGDIDNQDIIILLQNYYSQIFPEGDFDSNNQVNSIDYALIYNAIINTLPSPSPSPICKQINEECNNSFDCCENLICDYQDKQCWQINENHKYYYYTVADESFCLYTNNSHAIKGAWDSFHGTAKLGPQGPVTKTGSGGFNYGYGGLPDEKYWRCWNWHFIPEQVNMVEASLEVCDGIPSAVEYNWTEGRIYCPWLAQIEQLGCPEGCP